MGAQVSFWSTECLGMLEAPQGGHKAGPAVNNLAATDFKPLDLDFVICLTIGCYKFSKAMSSLSHISYCFSMFIHIVDRVHFLTVIGLNSSFSSTWLLQAAQFKRPL